MSLSSFVTDTLHRIRSNPPASQETALGRARAYIEAHQTPPLVATDAG